MGYQGVTPHRPDSEDWRVYLLAVAMILLLGLIMLLGR